MHTNYVYAPMDIHDRYTYEVQHEIVLLITKKTNNAILSQLSIKFEIPDDIGRMHESWKTIATTVEYEDDHY